MVKPVKYMAMFVAILSLMLMMSSLSVAASIEATIDRNTVQENESINLTFSSDTDVDDDPDFSPLEKDYRILNRSQSSNISIINGRVSRQMTWQLMLMPKRSGNLNVPAIAFGNDRSNALTLNVVPATAGSSGIADDLVYVEAIVDKDKVYVQSQLVYTLRIYHAVQLRNASLSELEISDGDAVVEKLSENKTYEKIID
ncbi:BatD family protein, partial [Kaarinaea lacus]